METLEQASLRERALAALREGRADEAVELLTPAAQAGPPDVQTLSLLGAAYGQAGRTEDAVGALERAAALSPSAAGVQYNLGVAYARAGRPEQARAALHAALAADPSYERARTALQSLEGTAPAPDLAAAPQPEPAGEQTAAPASPFAVAESAAQMGTGAPPPAGESQPAPWGPPPAQAAAPTLPMGAGVPPVVSPRAAGASPGTRILMGILWGALVMGGWQALWTLVAAAGAGITVMLVAAVMFGIVACVFGAIMGAVIAAQGAVPEKAAIVGAVGNVLFRLGILLLDQAPPSRMVVSLLISAWVGAWLGRVIAGRVPPAKGWGA